MKHTLNTSSLKLIMLDRDGVINEESEKYIKSPAEWHPIAGSLEAIAALSTHGYTLAVVTNQSGIARGLFKEKTLASIHEKMQHMVNSHGGKIDTILYCPHHPDDHCQCRKPLPGMFLKLEKHYHQSLKNVPYIGDSFKDIVVARKLGMKPILVLTGNGLKTLPLIKETRDVAVFQNLALAAKAIIENKIFM